VSVGKKGKEHTQTAGEVRREFRKLKKIARRSVKDGLSNGTCSHDKKKTNMKMENDTLPR